MRFVNQKHRQQANAFSFANEKQSYQIHYIFLIDRVFSTTKTTTKKDIQVYPIRTKIGSYMYNSQGFWHSL